MPVKPVNEKECPCYVAVAQLCQHRTKYLGVNGCTCASQAAYDRRNANELGGVPCTKRGCPRKEKKVAS